MSAAIPIRVLRYQCPHCRRTRAHKASAERHIARCFRNPSARGCLTCAWFEPGEKGDGYPYGYPGCPEGCGEGFDITHAAGGLRSQCVRWVDKDSDDDMPYGGDGTDLPLSIL